MQEILLNTKLISGRNHPTHVGMGRTIKHNTQRLLLANRFKLRIFLLWGDSATHCTTLFSWIINHWFYLRHENYSSCKNLFFYFYYSYLVLKLIQSIYCRNTGNSKRTQKPFWTFRIWCGKNISPLRIRLDNLPRAYIHK